MLRATEECDHLWAVLKVVVWPEKVCMVFLTQAASPRIWVGGRTYVADKKVKGMINCYAREGCCSVVPFHPTLKRLRHGHESLETFLNSAEPALDAISLSVGKGIGSCETRHG